MSDLNPYDKFLDGRHVDAILRATPDEIARHLEAIGIEKSTQPPAPGKWTAAEIICHLADCEFVFAFRLRQTLAEDAPSFSPSTRRSGPHVSRYPRRRSVGRLLRDAQLESAPVLDRFARCR